MKHLYALLIGVLFGGILVKSEALSWFRIQEMFWFQSFHMYGIIGSAIVVGAISLQIFKKIEAKSISGEIINPANKKFNNCLLYTSPSPRDRTRSRMPSSA